MTSLVGVPWVGLVLAAALLAGCVAAKGSPATPTLLPATSTGVSTSPSGPLTTPMPPLATTPFPPSATTPPSPTQPPLAATPTPKANGGAISTLVIADGAVAPPFPFLVGDSVVPDSARPSRALPLRRCDSAPDCSGAAQLGPQTLISPDGHYILYQGFEANGMLKAASTPVAETVITPTLRLLDLRTGLDRLLVSGALDPILGGDGRLAYIKGEQPAHELPRFSYSGRVVVRPSFDGPETVWTTGAGDYGCFAWAGARLICARPDALVALGGPNSQWVLARQFQTLVAVSPDGSRAIVTTAGANTFTAVAHLVRVADGMELSHLVVPQPPESFGPDADWVGDRVVTRGWTVPGGRMHPFPYLAILRVDNDRLAIERIFGFGPRERLGGGPFAGIGQPRFIGAGPNHVGVWFGGPAPRPDHYLDCHLDVGRCLLSPPLSKDMGFLENPSRPFPRGSTSP